MSITVPFTPAATPDTLSPTVTPSPGIVPAPNVTFEVAFASTADDPAPVWTDLADLTGVAPVKSVSTSRGRPQETSEIQAGSLDATLDNADSRFTAGNAGSPYYPDVEVDKQVRVFVTPPAPYDSFAAYIFRGFMTSWSTDILRGFDYSTVSVKATDNSDGLADVELKSDFATELRNLKPYGYWPLGEPKDAEAAGDVSGNGRHNLPLKSYVGSSSVNGTFAFGSDPIAPSDDSTSLTLTPILVGASGDSGYYLELPRNMGLAYSQGFTFVVGFRTSEAMSTSATLIEANDAAGNNLLQIYLVGTLTGSPYSGLLEAFIWPGGGGSGNFMDSTRKYNDGKGHLLVAVVDDDARTLHLNVDGVALGSCSTPTSGAGTVIDGRITIGIGTGITSTGSPWLGDLGHIGVIKRPLSGAEVAKLWNGWTGFPGEDADNRIRRYLSYVTWPAGTVFDDADTVLGLQPVGGLDVLTAINNAATSEQGLFFIGADGTARFHRRKHRVNKPSRVTFDSTLPVTRDLGPFTQDRQDIENDITGTRPGGATQRVTDEDSISNHRRKTASLQLAVLNDDELLDAINWRKARNAQPKIRVGSITLNPFITPALWPWALGLEIGDRITVDDLPPTAPATSMDFFIESVAHSSTATSYATTFQLSPADNWEYWQIGVAGYSELDLTTRLAY